MYCISLTAIAALYYRTSLSCKQHDWQVGLFNFPCIASIIGPLTSSGTVP